MVDNASLTIWGSVIAVGGVIAGAVLSMVGAALVENRRQKHDRASFERSTTIQREQELRAAASQFLIACRRFVEAYRSNFVRVADAGGGLRFVPRSDDLAFNELSSVYEPYWTVVFLGSSDQQAAARRLMDSVRPFKIRRAEGGGFHALTDGAYKKSSDDHIRVRSAFVKAMQV